jgi:hypothetical protein
MLTGAFEEWIEYAADPEVVALHRFLSHLERDVRERLVRSRLLSGALFESGRASSAAFPPKATDYPADVPSPQEEGESSREGGSKRQEEAPAALVRTPSSAVVLRNGIRAAKGADGQSDDSNGTTEQKEKRRRRRERICCCCCCCPPGVVRCWRWWGGIWSGKGGDASVRFWGVFPWVISVSMLMLFSFFSLYTAMSVFRDDTIYVVMWCEALGFSLMQGWLVQDVIVIVVRNNLACTKKRIRSHRYQILEKFVVAPLSICLKVLRDNTVI